MVKKTSKTASMVSVQDKQYGELDGVIAKQELASLDEKMLHSLQREVSAVVYLIKEVGVQFNELAKLGRLDHMPLQSILQYYKHVHELMKDGVAMDQLMDIADENHKALHYLLKHYPTLHTLLGRDHSISFADFTTLAMHHENALLDMVEHAEAVKYHIESGVSLARLTELAKNNPDAFYQILTEPHSDEAKYWLLDL